MSSSSSEGDLEVDVDDVDDSICILCNGTTYIGQTIACETCHLWFHFGCVGVKPGDDVVEKEDVPFFCPRCKKQKQKKGGAAATATTKMPSAAKKKRGGKATAKRKKQPPTAPKSKALSSPISQPPPPNSASNPLPSPPIKLKISFGKGRSESSSSSSSLPSASASSLITSNVVETSAPVTASPDGQSGVPAVGTPVLPSISRVLQSSASVGLQQNRRNSSTDDGGGGNSSPDNRGRRKRRKSEVEEEKWLDAVEAGNVNIVDPELKSIKDPKLMTARQRAMVERQKTAGDDLSLEESGHMALDYGYKKKEENEETLKIKAIKSQKRKEIELEKREQDKKKTMDRLLKKKDSKTSKQTRFNKGTKREFARITYLLDSEGGHTISLPPNMEFPFRTQKPVKAPHVTPCSVPDCNNAKKYSCSKSGKPLCSLQCYKKNSALLMMAAA